MKTKTSFLITVLSLVFSSRLCGQIQNSSEKKAMEVIEAFYNNYITEISKMPFSIEKIDSIKKMYCSTDLLAQLKNEEQDYDPFLNAQDFSTDELKSLLIQKDTERESTYTVSYIENFKHSTIEIHVEVVKYKEGWKINAVW